MKPQCLAFTFQKIGADMKIKTSDLTGAALDWAVAEAEGLLKPLGVFPHGSIGVLSGGLVALRYCSDPDASGYQPSTDWAQGGPIIEREKIALTSYLRADLVTQWRAVTFTSGTVPVYGPAPLIAAMRCFVASKLGDEVEIPDELQ